MAMAPLSLSTNSRLLSPCPQSLSSFSCCSAGLTPLLRNLKLSDGLTLTRKSLKCRASDMAGLSKAATAAAEAIGIEPICLDAVPAPADMKQFVKSKLPGGIAAQELLGTGRRKRAVARVALVEGTGHIIINQRTASDYLQGNPLWMQYVKFPLSTLGYDKKYDVIVKAHGGGLSAQAQAILLGIARALVVANSANRDPLKKQGFLRRDPRRVERKKYGLHKARKAPQFSKR